MPIVPPVVIVADGAFPTHAYPLSALDQAMTIICCDGAADQLLRRSITPHVVIGDLDSLSPQAKNAFGDRLVPLPSQQFSDLEKALRWAADEGASQVTILGATGQRDDHSLGNLLMLFVDLGLEVGLLTDTGAFSVVRGSRSFASFPGQVVSLFPESALVQLTTTGLAFALQHEPLPALHRGTSNHSTGAEFSVMSTNGAAVVYQEYAQEH